jgi:hypothetical protein
MQKKILAGAVALSALGLAATGAFTASNTMPAGGVQGYGQVVSTGATVTSVTANTVTDDASKLASVVFSTTTDVTAKTNKLTLKNGSTIVGSSYSCTVSGSASPWTITCNTADNPLLNSFDTTGLTVL